MYIKSAIRREHSSQSAGRLKAPARPPWRYLEQAFVQISTNCNKATQTTWRTRRSAVPRKWLSLQYKLYRGARILNEACAMTSNSIRPELHEAVDFPPISTPEVRARSWAIAWIFYTLRDTRRGRLEVCGIAVLVFVAFSTYSVGYCGSRFRHIARCRYK